MYMRLSYNKEDESEYGLSNDTVVNSKGKAFNINPNMMSTNYNQLYSYESINNQTIDEVTEGILAPSSIQTITGSTRGNLPSQLSGSNSFGWENHSSYNVDSIFGTQANNKSVRPFITAVNCDPYYDLVWLGWTNGYINSFVFPHFTRYSSFPVYISPNVSNHIDNIHISRENIIKTGFLSSSHIYTVTKNGIAVCTRGGMLSSSYSLKSLTDDSRQITRSQIWCCDTSVYSSYTNSETSFGLGTDSGVSILDLNQLHPIHHIPYSGGISSISNSGNMNNFIVGGLNMIGVADTRLPRLGQVVNILNDKTMVTGLAVNEYTIAVITSTIDNIAHDKLLSCVCGTSGLPVLDLLNLHPGEVSTSSEMMNYKKNLDLSKFKRDPIIRLFDTRRFHFRKNILFTPGPTGIMWGNDSNTSDSLYIYGNNGQWQIYHSNLDHMEFHSTPFTSISSASLSTSGQYIIFSDTSGSISTLEKVCNTTTTLPSINTNKPSNVDSSNHSNISITQLGVSTNANNNISIHHSSPFNAYQSYPLESLNMLNTETSLYASNFQKSVHLLSGIASNPITKHSNNSLTKTPTLTVALRYLKGRSVIAYDSLNPVGIPPIVAYSKNTKQKNKRELIIKDDEFVSYSNRYNIEILRKIQNEYRWGKIKFSDEINSGLTLNKLIKSKQFNELETNHVEKEHINLDSKSISWISLDYIKNIRPELEEFNCKSLNYKRMDFLRVAINIDTNKYKVNSLVYGLPLLCKNGIFPIWYYKQKNRLNVNVNGSTNNNLLTGFNFIDAASMKILSHVPLRFQYRPRAFVSRRDRQKNKKNIEHDYPSSFINSSTQKPLDDDQNHPFTDLEQIFIELDHDSLDFTQPFFMLIIFIKNLIYDILLLHVPYCKSEFCISCELVHLGFMIYSATNRNKHQIPFKLPNWQYEQLLNQPNNGISSIYSMNILRSIRHLPEVSLLGIDSDYQVTPNKNKNDFNKRTLNPNETKVSIIDGKKSNLNMEDEYLQPQVYYQFRKLEMFWRFLLEQLSKELSEIPIINNSLYELFSFQVFTLTSCIKAKHAVKTMHNMFLFEMNYSIDFNKLNEKNSQYSVFFEILNISLNRSITSKGFCKQCNTTRQCQYNRTVVSLPKIMLINTSIVSMNEWKYYGANVDIEDSSVDQKTPLINIPEIIYISSNNNTFIVNENPTNTKVKSNKPTTQSNIKQNKSEISTLNNNETIEYELSGVIFGVYQGSSIHLSSGIHFCLYAKCNLFNKLNDIWVLINGSNVSLANKSEVINFSSSWKIPSFFIYSQVNKNNKSIFSPYISQSINIDEKIMNAITYQDCIPTSLSNNLYIDIGLDSMLPIPWDYPQHIKDHVVSMIRSTIHLIKNEKNLAENPSHRKNEYQITFNDDELKLLSFHYYIRYPFVRGLIKTSSDQINDYVLNPPMIVSLDSEYVALDAEHSITRNDGTKEVLKRSQLSLARVSIIRCNHLINKLTTCSNFNEYKNNNLIIMDQYISYGGTTKQPFDYLTRYSGVKPGDLDPRTSTHFLTTKCNILKKLQFMVDSGVIFIGHGLSSDFKIINIYVNPQQIIDTVEIYRIHDERYISLRFLAKYVLQKSIQNDIHDSVEDAKVAFELYEKYLNYKKNSVWNDFLNSLYTKGHATDWKVDSLDSSSVFFADK